MCEPFGWGLLRFSLDSGREAGVNEGEGEKPPAILENRARSFSHVFPRLSFRRSPFDSVAHTGDGSIEPVVERLHFDPALARSADLRSEVLVEPVHFATGWSGDSVLLVELNGVLSAEPETGGFLSEPGTLVHLKDALKKAEEDPFVQALLVRIDSPGGSVTASDLIYTELKRFKERTKKKVVAVCMGTAASGGYYAAMAADYIVVHPTTVTGSIGVISMYPNLSGLAKLARVDMRVLKSGERKDMGSMWREMEPAEREILQGVINSMYERFLEVVAAGRPNLSADKIRELADGRIYTAQQAVELGLADESGISRCLPQSSGTGRAQGRRVGGLQAAGRL